MSVAPAVYERIMHLLEAEGIKVMFGDSAFIAAASGGGPLAPALLLIRD